MKEYKGGVRKIGIVLFTLSESDLNWIKVMKCNKNIVVSDSYLFELIIIGKSLLPENSGPFYYTITLL